ncbi:MAG: trypsin-like serine protease [Myxococcales bacterium]|nr:trypsin-like serine protease [Myxococcales bacterium]
MHLAGLCWAMDPARSAGDLTWTDTERPTENPPDPGRSGPRVEGVVGGSPAIAGDWPDAAAIFIGEDFFACSGVLVAPDVVLTAAHCKGGATAKHVRLDTVDHTDGTYERIEVAQAFAHEDPYRTYDIAALVLDEPSTIEPRLILRDCFADDYLAEGAAVSIVGFGALDEWGIEGTSLLHEANTEVHDPDCSDLTKGCNEQVSPGGELVAGGDGIDSCVGDSGGPLYLHTVDGIFLTGITSRAALPAPTACGHGGIYVRADAVIDWVEEVTGRTLWAPDCGTLNRPPRPTADPLVVELGGTAQVQVQPEDPNPDDVHTFEIVQPPIHGEAALTEDGQLTFRAARHVFADTAVTVLVRDDRGAEGTVVVEVDMVPGGDIRLQPRCGCSAAPSGPASLAAGVLLLALARRRRDEPC